VQNFHIEINQIVQSIRKFCVVTASRPQPKHVFRCALFQKSVQRLNDMYFSSYFVPNLIKWRTVCYWEIIFELLSEIKSLDVKRTVTVLARILEPLNEIINFHLRSSLRALSNDNH
jgi:hypothetical protein